MTFYSFFQNNFLTILFYVVVILLIVFFRKKFEWQSKFIGLYKTKIGLKTMKSLSRHKRLFKTLGYIGIFFGFLGMIVILFELIKGLYLLLFTANANAVIAPVIPGFAVPGFGIKVPLITGWIALFVVILVHEFFHGVISQSHGLKVKSSGLLVFGPILGAFVEPDEKRLIKKKDSVQHSIFAAGPFSNILFAFIFNILLLLILVPIVISMTLPVGVKITNVAENSPAAIAGLEKDSLVTKVNGVEVRSVEEMLTELENLKIGDSVVLITGEDEREINIVAEENPKETGKAYLGVNLKTERNLKDKSWINKVVFAVFMWLNELFYWLVILNLGIGLANLLPLGPVDGGRMVQTLFRRIFGKENGDYWWKKVSAITLLLIILLLIIPLLKGLGI